MFLNLAGREGRGKMVGSTGRRSHKVVGEHVAIKGEV